MKGECESCSTTFFFDIRAERNRKETLNLVVTRKINRYRRCTDRASINQTVDPADFEEYERAWKATNAECERRVGSVLPFRMECWRQQRRIEQVGHVEAKLQTIVLGTLEHKVSNTR